MLTKHSTCEKSIIVAGRNAMEEGYSKEMAEQLSATQREERLSEREESPNITSAGQCRIHVCLCFKFKLTTVKEKYKYFRKMYL